TRLTSRRIGHQDLCSSNHSATLIGNRAIDAGATALTKANRAQQQQPPCQNRNSHTPPNLGGSVRTRPLAHEPLLLSTVGERNALREPVQTSVLASQPSWFRFWSLTYPDADGGFLLRLHMVVKGYFGICSETKPPVTVSSVNTVFCSRGIQIVALKAQGE